MTVGPAPIHFLKDTPTEQTVIFAGEYIDLTALARATGLNITYLSHIFSANSPKLPSTKYGMRLAEHLGMKYPDFIAEIISKKHAESE